jgi:protein-S-isoprenylcysteine O-methyltransferase Ste14
MLPFLRHLLSIVLLPFTVLAIVPVLILTVWEKESVFSGISSPFFWLSKIAGVILILVGFALLAWCETLFARIGRGTLAPWDPPRHLVVKGPYQFVRNPMIISVGLILMGEALFWGSWGIGAWACFFLVMNHSYFLFSEEPGLEKRFGELYRSYKANVPRWIPKLKPWKGTQEDG